MRVPARPIAWPVVCRWPSRATIVLVLVVSARATVRGAGPITAVRVAVAPNEAVWATAPPTTDFVQREPAEGGSPSERTDVRVLYDAATLYVRVQAFDAEPNRILTYLTRRDVESPCDWIRVLIDSYHDRRTAYEFAVNPSGVKLDAYWYNDTSRDDSWDAIWDVTVSRTDQGWSAEFRIPFSQLRFRPAADTTFGFAVSRQVGRLNETSTWPLLARSATGYVSGFGELRGLSMAASPSPLEVVPYAVGSLTTQPTNGNPLLKSTNPDLSLGVDVKYALTPGLTITGTINPDFGQVEADPAVVNLSAFETFFQERRPFFIEGAGTFAFGIDCPDCAGLFYSRRIGRSPQGTDALPVDDNVQTNAPSQTSILGAVKLTGRVGAVSLGVLHAITREEQATVLDGTRRYEQPIEPLTNYSVATARRDFRNQSSIGAMVTSANREPASGLSFLPDHAHAAGVTFDWRFADRFSLAGNAIGSLVTGSAEAIERLQEDSVHYLQRPDVVVNRFDPTQTSLVGSAGRLSFGKLGGQRVRFNSNVGFKTPGFDVNALGFQQRADERTLNNWFQLRSDKPDHWFRSRMINFNQYARWNFDGERLSSGGNINAHAIFVNNWHIGAGGNLNQRELDDRRSRGGPAGFNEGYTTGWYYVNTDNRRRVGLNFEENLGRDGHGSWFRNYQPELVLRPTPPFTASFGLRFARDVLDSQWIENVTESKTTTHYVFGHLDQTTFSLRARVSYALASTVSLQLYAEPFVSAGHYTHIKELTDGRNPVYASRYASYAYDSNPDFNVKSFRSTNVLRWEYRRGSSLFVVWQQARSATADEGAFRFPTDVANIFATPPTNVLLVKFAYWLNY